MKKRTILCLASILCFIAIHTQSVFATSNTELENRIKQLEQQADKTESSGLGQISDAITLSGAIEVDYSYTGDSDVTSNSINDSTSELDVGTIELGIEAKVHDYITAIALLKGESLDSSSDRIFWDEVFFEIKKQDFPVYLVAGKRCQAFGAFESSFINDPITQDLYEVNKTGLTVGYNDEAIWNIDLSVTAYKGETLITKVNDAGYGWSRSNTAGYAATNDVDSFIVSGSVSPVEGIVLSAFFNSEPGDSQRNTTMGSAIHFEIGNFMADAEYIGAIDREKHNTDKLEYTESAWVASIGYQILDSLLFALRYESFDADKTAAGNLENRYGAALTYTLFQAESFACNLMGEYRKTNYETTAASTIDDDVDEFFVRLAIEF
ncbi:MAG: LbtU family siderophore porin [Pseudomonadota bacterium]